jgi:hypothetical protein
MDTTQTLIKQSISEKSGNTSALGWKVTQDPRKAVHVSSGRTAPYYHRQRGDWAHLSNYSITSHVVEDEKLTYKPPIAKTPIKSIL